ncbi:MAG TPA: DNA-binding domain-containing protein [Aestuariivirgaceae bacterium]|jgi:hypothetical protein
MRNVAELQSEITLAILSGDVSSLVSELKTSNADVSRRFAIYRNNTLLSLTNHLKAVFPVTARLGDERFFAYAAHEFIRRSPPSEPRLSAYGAGLAKFLSRFAPCRDAPILSEMAALEWAVQSALTSEDKPPLGANTLSSAVPLEGSGARLVLQPSLNFTLSRWPLIPLWRMNGSSDSPLRPRLSRIAVLRSGDKVRLFDLPSARFVFWRSIAKGAPLDHATMRAIARDPQFDLVGEIVMLFRAGFVTGVESAKAH